MNEAAQDNPGSESKASTRKRYSPLRYAQQMLYLTIKFLLRFLPLPLLFRLKQDILPIVRLDYLGAKIRLHVDSLKTWKRAQACSKEPSTVKWLETHLRDGDVFYDIGANVGAYSLVAASQAGKKVKVCAFEPSFSTYVYLCRNVILNGLQSSISTYRNPLAAQTGHSVFHYQSLEAGAAMHALGESVDQTGEQFQPVYSQTAISFAIDELVQRFGLPVPHLIKLDVDGIELGILQGARDTLSDTRLRSLLVEVDNESPDGQREGIIAFLAERGLVLTQQESHGSTVLNFIFVRAD